LTFSSPYFISVMPNLPSQVTDKNGVSILYTIARFWEHVIVGIFYFIFAGINAINSDYKV